MGKGDLVTVTKKDKKFPYLLDDAGKWTVRNDVYFQEARLAEGGKGCPLSAAANKCCRSAIPSGRKWASVTSWAPSTTSRCC